MRKTSFMEHGTIVYGALIASAVIAVLSFAGLLVLPLTPVEWADMRIEPLNGNVKVGDIFTVDIIVSAETPVNVFKGEVFFDPARLVVDSIDYNTSIADLWVERPWYENGEGTMNFAGGTTRKGGFLGTGSLITIRFRTLAAGDTSLRLEGARILEHNGLGTDVTLSKPLDAIFTVEEAIIESQTVAKPEPISVTLDVVEVPPTTDLNGDGRQTIGDISIFMLNMFGNDARFDFNLDGSVNGKDLSILMSAD